MSTSLLPALRHSDPADLELWLEREAAAGARLTSFDRLSPVRMRFEPSTPANVRYAFEHRAEPAPTDYYTVRAERGWEHVGAAGETHLWRREYTGTRPEGFIGDQIGRRARMAGIGLAVTSVVFLILAVSLAGYYFGAELGGLTGRDYWAPAIAFAVAGVASATAATVYFTSRRKARIEVAALADENHDPAERRETVGAAR